MASGVRVRGVVTLLRLTAADVSAGCAHAEIERAAALLAVQSQWLGSAVGGVRALGRRYGRDIHCPQYLGKAQAGAQRGLRFEAGPL